MDRNLLLLLAGVAVVTAILQSIGRAQPPAEKAAQAPAGNEAVANQGPANQVPLGQFITVANVVDDVAFGRVSRIALALQTRVRQEKRPGILILEVGPGSSQFHHIQGLAKFISTELPSLTTVAWIPETIRGNHVVLALACQEIVMKSDAELGDIGLGKPVDLDERQFVVNLVNRRHNKRLSEALALGMMDPQKEVIWVQLESGVKPNLVTETRVVLPSEFDRLLKSKAAILKHETIKTPGTDGLISGEKGRAYNILVTHLANSRDEVGGQYRLAREAMREDPGAGAAPRAMLIHVDEMIDPMLEQFVQRQIQRAVASGCNLIVFEIDSPGGLLLSSTNLANAIIDLQSKQVRTVAYIPKMALSGAAIIALGCDEIYMQPHAKIGDAAPIEMRNGGQFERAPEKILSLLKDYLKTYAEKKKRPVALAEAMADKSYRVYEVTHRETGQLWFMTDDEIHNANGQWVKGRLIPETGRDLLLTVDGRRAHALHLAEAPVDDLDDLKARLGISADAPLQISARTWVDSLIFELNKPGMTVLLFLIGIFCIYLEMHFPAGIFGICSALAFGLFFWSRFLGGTAGWLEVTLFLLGLACLLLEIFVIPGFGVFGVSGGLLILFSIILASQTFVIPHSTAELHVLARSVATLSGAFAGVVVLAVLVGRYLPSIPLFNSMILMPPGAAEFEAGAPRLRPEFSSSNSQSLREPYGALLGKVGVATTVLRPAGKAQIGDEFVDVVSEGPFIRAGSQVEVTLVNGNRVVVREIG